MGGTRGVVGRSGRDRHGRGPRGPLAPAAVPLSGTRADRFDDEAVAAVDRVYESLSPERSRRLGPLDVVVRDVPPTAGSDPVPLGAVVPASGGRAAQVLVFRRPVELRVQGRPELRALLREVAVEQVAALLGLDPAELDPSYPDDE